MKKYLSLLFWQNISRRRQLEKYQNQIEEYFHLIDYNEFDRDIIDNQESKEIRKLLNRQTEVIEIYIIEAGLSPYVTHYDAPAMGGRVTSINLIENLFNLQHYDIEPQSIIDTIDQALGVYERDFVK